MVNIFYFVIYEVMFLHFGIILSIYSVCLRHIYIYIYIYISNYNMNLTRQCIKFEKLQTSCTDVYISSASSISFWYIYISKILYQNSKLILPHKKVFNSSPTQKHFSISNGPKSDTSFNQNCRNIFCKEIGIYVEMEEEYIGIQDYPFFSL